VATLLIERGADVNLTPKQGSNPLQVAIYRGFHPSQLKPVAGYPELIRLLIDKGTNVNWVDGHGNTPLIAAAEMDDLATFRLLQQHGVDLKQTDRMD
jgi:ankyrin repeat protein